MTLYSDCVGYFKLENNFTDETSTSTMTNNSTTDNASGKIGRCRTFGGDGTGQYLSIADGSGIMESTACSFNCWAKTHDTGRATRQAIIWKQAANVGFFITYRCDTNDSLNYGVGNGDYSTSASVLNDNDWHMFTLTYNNDTGDTNLWLDGVQVGDSSAVKNIVADGVNMRIGMIGSEDFEWDGEIDSIGFWDVELTSDQIATLYNSGTGLDYPFAVNATVTPATLTLSTTDAEPVFKISPTTLSLGSSLNLANARTIIENRIELRKTIGTRYLNKHYVDAPYIYKNGVARKVGYYGS